MLYNNKLFEKRWNWIKKRVMSRYKARKKVGRGLYGKYEVIIFLDYSLLGEEDGFITLKKRRSVIESGFLDSDWSDLEKFFKKELWI